MLVKIKHKQVADLPYLMRLVLKFVYDERNMTIAEIHLMQYSIVAWSQKIALDKDLGRSLEDEAEHVERIGWMLKQNEDGQFDRRKALFKEHGIDWRKFHRLPEAYVQADFDRAQEEYKKWCAEHPEEA